MKTLELLSDFNLILLEKIIKKKKINLRSKNLIFLIFFFN